MATWDRYKAKTSGLEVIGQKGARFTPRFYCDDTTGTIYATKAPVAVLDLDPLIQFTDTNIAWDVSNSVSATGTIDTFDLTFGGGGASDLTAQDWSSDPKTGNVQYTTAGTYTVTLYVTDTAGNRSHAAKQTVTIVADDDEDIATANTGALVYIATSDSGIYTYSSSGAPATANTGLSGGDLNVNSGRLNPHFQHMPTSQHHYWLCNDNGLAYSVNGCSTYTKITKATLGAPRNTARDATTPTTSDLEEIAVAFDPKNVRRVYLLRTTDSTWNASNEARSFVYFTDDYGATWDNIGVGTEGQGFDLKLSTSGNARDSIAVSQSGDNVFVALEDESSGNQKVFNFARDDELDVITGCGGVGWQLFDHDWTTRGSGDITLDGTSRVLTARQHSSTLVWYVAVQVAVPQTGLYVWDDCDYIPSECVGSTSERFLVNFTSVSLTATSTAASRCTNGTRVVVWQKSGNPTFDTNYNVSWFEVLHNTTQFTVTLTLDEATA